MLLKNCRLIPQLSDGVTFELADISIRDGKIQAVRPAQMNGDNLEADDVLDEVIDCKGMTVLPGLFDLHVHLAWEPVGENAVWHAFELYHKKAAQMKTFLDYGVTTIRDCGSTLQLGCYLRDGIERGIFEGPRVLTSGVIISPEALRNKVDVGFHLTANGPDEMMKAARRQFAAGADFIKIYATQSMQQVRGQDPKAILTGEEIDAAVAVAKSQNSYVAAHAHTADAINVCLKHGVRTIEHATYMDEESLKLLTTLPDVYTVPTSAVAEPYADGDGYNDPQELERWNSPYMKESCRRCRSKEREAYLRGVKMGIGTDLYIENFKKYPYEFRVRKESCGMENIDILLQATKISAQIAGVSGFTGEVREGYAADLIAVSGKPDEDIRVMYKRPMLVMKAGKVHKQQDRTA